MTDRICSTEGCPNKHYGRGLCRKHWQAERPQCAIAGCGGSVVARGWCRMHYGRWHKTGDPQADVARLVRFETAAEYFFAHVAKTPSCWNWTGPIKESGYGMASHRLMRQGAEVRAHRFAYELLVGIIPDGMVIDHRCHNRRCVNPAHLRPVTGKQNNENRRGAAKHNQSGVRGVAWHRASKKWIARVGHNGRSIYLGCFDNIQEAESVAIAKRIELFTHNDRDRIA